MLTVCAWCQAEGRDNVTEVLKLAVFGEPISHGICREHAAALVRTLPTLAKVERRLVRA